MRQKFKENENIINEQPCAPFRPALAILGKGKGRARPTGPRPPAGLRPPAPRPRLPPASALPPLCALRARPPLLPHRTATPARGSAFPSAIPGSSPGRSAPSRARTRAPSPDTAPGGWRLLAHEGRRTQRRAPPGFLLLQPRRGERPRPRTAATNGCAER